MVYGINNTCLLNMTDWWLPDSDFQLNIDMEPAPPRDCSIRGYLRDAVNGFGLSGETLTAISDTYMNWTTTNGSGFYNMSFIPEKYGMGAESDGYEGTSLNFKLESGRHIWRNISLEPLNCYLRGFIKDDGGAPISGANVRVREPWDRDYNNFTDPAGYYELNLTRGTKSVSIRASGCLWNSGTAEMTSGNITWLNVTMVPFPAYEFTLRGYVEEYNTTDPVNNTEVRLRADLQNGTWSNSTFTDATGYYEIMAPAFDLQVTAIGENHMENGTVVTGIAGQTIWQNITITNNTDWATLSGNVTLDGTPAQWANIAGTYWSETYWSPTYGTSSDAAGEYILNLPAGYVEVTCSAEKSNIERVSFELKPNEVFWYDFSLSTLEFDSIMLGKVTDQIGDPVQNSFFYFMNDMRSQTFSTVGITDFNGTYEVAVPRGELIYISFTEDYKVEAGTVDITQEWNWFNLSLTPLPGEVMVRGYLRSVNMVPIPGQQMSASMVDPLGDSHSWWMDMYWFNQPTSNLTGYYEFSAPKGEVSLVLTYVDGYYGLSGGGGLSVDTSSGTDIWQNFTLRPRPCFSEIWGKVKQSDETNVSGALVTAIIGSREFTAFTDLNGNYTLNVPEGALKISARKNGFGCIDTQYIYLYQSGQLEWVNMTLDPASAWLELPITDSVVDLDGDGKHDWLYVNVTVNVSNPGNYMISGTLKSTRWITGDGMESSEVGRTANETSLDAGVHTVRLAFNGPSLYLSEMDGYYVEVELRESQDWQSLDRRGQQISKYSWTDFDVPDVEIVDPCHTFGPVDTDFDGLYNMLLFNTTVNVLAPGNYTFMGQIMNLRTDENYEPFENIMIFEELQAGINTIEFDFSGTRIFNSGCHLGMVSVMIFNGSVDMSGGNIIGMSQVYVPYNYTKFQHYPIDSLVYGWVNDTTNTPIANISVELYNITRTTLNETMTDSDGYYELGGWEGDWLLVMDDGDDTDGEYQGNLTTITPNAVAPLKENRILQDAALDTMTR
ncbi:MAG: carboxypeptidase regulatory-like domain-containing protein, partial [Thermoplasmata archaeon]|nr:carboxypeptidase regulatory-like domain-containing protein [Thermoplasmata archaeon]